MIRRFTITTATMPVLVALVLAFGLTGCQSAYYGAMEKFGYEKRDLLAARVKDTRKAQEKAQSQFADASEEFAALMNLDGSKLERQYKKVKSSYEEAKDRADDVIERRKEMEQVGNAMFTEWEKEIDLYDSSTLKQQSARKLRTTQTKFRQLVGTMKQVEYQMEPILKPFRDRVLFLKHNLNARSLSAMEREQLSIKRDVDDLISDMQAAIEEANAFIASMKED